MMCTIMMMASGSGGCEALETLLQPVARELGLQVHAYAVRGGLHRHLVPNIQVRVTGADRAGIVAKVTGALAEAGFNILELESDVAGTEEEPVYILCIQGYSEVTVEALQDALERIGELDVTASVAPIETLIG